MAIEEYPRETKEFVPVIVEGSPNLEALPVEMTITTYGARPTVWKTAEWDVNAAGDTVAKVKIGPGTDFDFSSSPGTKIPWVRITTTQEQPLIEGEPIEVT